MSPPKFPASPPRFPAPPPWLPASLPQSAPRLDPISGLPSSDVSISVGLSSDIPTLAFAWLGCGLLRGAPPGAVSNVGSKAFQRRQDGQTHVAKACHVGSMAHSITLMSPQATWNIFGSCVPKVVFLHGILFCLDSKLIFFVSGTLYFLIS